MVNLFRAGLIALLAAAILSTVIIIGFVLTVYSPGGYTVNPGTGGVDDGQSPPTDARGTSYRDLPLWIQVAALLDAVLLATGAFGIFCPVAGRILDLMGNQNRLSIYNYVANNPGCTQAEIAMRQNMREGTVKYHLLMLETEGKIIRKRMGKFTRLFRNSGTSDLERKIASRIRNEMSRNVLLAILRSPGITNQDLSERFGIEKSSVHWHIDRLLEDGIILILQDGRHKQYYMKDDAKDILLKLTGNGLTTDVAQPAAAASHGT
jgi:predicted transcriptional regulator